MTSFVDPIPNISGILVPTNAKPHTTAIASYSPLLLVFTSSYSDEECWRTPVPWTLKTKGEAPVCFYVGKSAESTQYDSKVTKNPKEYETSYK